MGEQMKRTSESNRSLEKAYTLNLHSVKKNKEFMIEAWIYIFDNICLTKMKQTKDCFRKKVVKFYKNYFPEYSYFKDVLKFPEFKDLPDKKNYLERVQNSQRFYKPSYQLQVDQIVGERNEEDNDEFYDIVYQFKKLIKNLLHITYNSFYNESLILKDSLILEFCYQQLKYLEMEYFYCQMVFKIQAKTFLLQRIICVIRRFYHFWVELLFETYCWYEKKKYSSRDQKFKIFNEEEKFLLENKDIDERLEKYKNFHNLSRKHLFFDQKHLPRDEQNKKASAENELYEFCLEELLQQDEFDDPSLYTEVIAKERRLFTQDRQREVHKQINSNLKVQNIIKYYPYILTSSNSNYQFEVKPIGRNPFGKPEIDDTQNFLKHIEMLVELNIKVLREFLSSEFKYWNYYEEQYIIIVQLYSFLQKALSTKSILISIVETYKHFSDIDGCNIGFQNPSSNMNNSEHKNQKVTALNQTTKKKPWWWRKLGGGIIQELELDEDLDFLGGDTDLIYDRESKVIERIVNQIVQQNNKRLLLLIDQYFKNEFEGEKLHDKGLYPIFLSDSILLQRNEFLLEDSLAFDLSIIICCDENKNSKSETRSESQLSPSNSLKKQLSSYEDDQVTSQLPKNGGINGKENNQNDNSIDIDDQYDEKEFQQEKQFYKTSFKPKLQSRRYIMPLQYQDLTFPENINIQVKLTEFKDSQSVNDPYFDEQLKQPNKAKMNDENMQRQKSSAFSVVSDSGREQKNVFERDSQYKLDETLINIATLKNQAKVIRELIPFESVRGYTKQTNLFDEFDYIGFYERTSSETEQSNNQNYYDFKK